VQIVDARPALATWQGRLQRDMALQCSYVTKQYTLCRLKSTH